MRKKAEGKKILLSDILCTVYPRVGNSVQKLIRKIFYMTEGGHFYSISLRRIFAENYKVVIGMYTYGNCFERYAFDRETTVGRYCSIAQGVTVLTHNHPLDRPSTHSFFFNNVLGVIEEYLVDHRPLVIGNDVWIGHNAIILPGVSRIGDGAVVGAGSVVTKDVEPYSIVVGNPARHLRFRFPPEEIEKLQSSKWWDNSIDELDLDYFKKKVI